MKSKTQPFRAGAAKLFFLCFLAYMFSYFGRYNLSTCLDSMVSEGIVTEQFGALISSAFLICYGIGQFVNGRLTMRISPKIMIAAGLFGSGICNILMSFSAPGLSVPIAVIWGLNGYFNAMLWSPIIRIFSEWMNENERARAGAHISPSIPFGMLTCYLITFLVLKFSEWRNVFLVCGTLLCVGAAIWLVGTFGLRKYIFSATESFRLQKEALTSDAPEKGNALSLAVFISTGLIVLVFASFFNGALKDAVISWVPQYLIDTFGFVPSNASLVSTLLPLFSIAGPYFAIWMNKKFFDNECATVGVLYGISAVCTIGMFLLGKNSPIPAVILMATSMACMWGVNSMLLTFVPYHFSASGISSAVTGTLNCIIFLGSSTSTYVYRALASGAVWDTTVLVWFGIGTVSCVSCLVFAKIWKRRRPSGKESV